MVSGSASTTADAKYDFETKADHGSIQQMVCSMWAEPTTSTYYRGDGGDYQACFVKNMQEACSGDNCTGYRGWQKTTKTGATCDLWSAYSDSNLRTNEGLDDRFCRN